MRIYIQTSLLTYLHQEFCLIWAAGGVGGLREDVTGVGNPLDALKDPSADLENLSADFGASHKVPMFTLLCQNLLGFLSQIINVYINVI